MKAQNWALLAAVACLVSACASQPPDRQTPMLQSAVFIVGEDNRAMPVSDMTEAPQAASASGPVLKLKRLSWFLSGR